MAYDRPSWSEIDKMRDKPGLRKKRDRDHNRDHDGLREHSTRYDRYKADLDRLFDQGMASELLKRESVDKEPTLPDNTKPKNASKSKVATVSRKSNGRIPRNAKNITSRLKLIRAVVDAEDRKALPKAIDELVLHFGLPDDWDVLIRVLEHPNEELLIQSVEKMSQLLARTAKIPRRYTLKERLRSISQTASDGDLRRQAKELEERL